MQSLYCNKSFSKCRSSFLKWQKVVQTLEVNHWPATAIFLAHQKIFTYKFPFLGCNPLNCSFPIALFPHEQKFFSSWFIFVWCRGEFWVSNFESWSSMFDSHWRICRLLVTISKSFKKYSGLPANGYSRMLKLLNKRYMREYTLSNCTLVLPVEAKSFHWSISYH